MSVNITTAFVQQYANTVQLLLQQQESRLEGMVTRGSYKGKQASPVEQIGAIEAQLVTDRFAPMGRVDAPFDRRWVLPADYDLPQLVDSYDVLRTIVDVKSPYAANARAAFGRVKDRVIYSALFGTNHTGETAATSTTFDSTNQTVGVSTGGTTSNLNVAKLKAARKILMSQNVDMSRERICCAVNASAHDALLSEIEIISSDFNGGVKPVLQDGLITRFLGIDFVHTELLTTATDDASGTSHQVPVWVQSGVHLGIWQDLQVNITQRDDLRGLPWQIYHNLTLGATRLEEKKVVRVWARQS